MFHSSPYNDVSLTPPRSYQPQANGSKTADMMSILPTQDMVEPINSKVTKPQAFTKLRSDLFSSLNS